MAGNVTWDWYNSWSASWVSRVQWWTGCTVLQTLFLQTIPKVLERYCGASSVSAPHAHPKDRLGGTPPSLQPQPQPAPLTKPAPLFTEAGSKGQNMEGCTSASSKQITVPQDAGGAAIRLAGHAAGLCFWAPFFFKKKCAVIESWSVWARRQI